MPRPVFKDERRVLIDSDAIELTNLAAQMKAKVLQDETYDDMFIEDRIINWPGGDSKLRGLDNKLYSYVFDKPVNFKCRQRALQVPIRIDTTTCTSSADHVASLGTDLPHPMDDTSTFKKPVFSVKGEAGYAIHDYSLECE